MKRRAVFGQWKTPPQVLYPSSSSGMKKSASTPVFPSGVFARSIMTPLNTPNNGNVKDEFDQDDYDDLDDSLGNLTFDGTGQGEVLDDNLMDTGLETNHLLEPLPGTGERKIGYSAENQFANSVAMPDFRTSSSREYVKDASVGGKRTAQGLARIRKLDLDDKGASSSCPDLVNLKKTSAKDKIEDLEDKKQKRLARNRAAARMRRQRRKTIVDTLEKEMVELERAISVLKDVNQYLDSNGGLDQGILALPVNTVKRAVETAPSLDASAELPSEAEPEKSPRLIQNQEQAKTEFLNYIVGNVKDKYSISIARRRSAIQYFVDVQMTSCRKLSLSGGMNMALGLAALKKASSFELQPLMEKRINSLRQARYTAVTNHLPGSPAAGVNSLDLKEGVSKPYNDETKRSKTIRQAVMIDTTKNANADIDMDESSSEEIETIRRELMEVLKLSPSQTKQLQKLSQGLEVERIRLHALERAALSFACHDWMEFPHLEQAHTHFRGLLSDNQLTSFHYFIQKNEKQINQLSLEAKVP